MFSYFKGNGEDGLHLAYSKDGINWTALNADSSFLVPRVGKESIMRDPSIVQDKNGTFHLVWSAGWWDTGIGYSSSKDLIHWTEQRYIPVMKDFKDAYNAWSPEIFYDKENHTFYVIWSSTVPGMFPQQPNVEGGIFGKMNHRQFYFTTKDFQTFSEVKVFFNPDGFMVIDGAILKKDKTYYYFLKNESSAPDRWQKNIRVTSNDKPYDFPTQVSEPIHGDYFAEGPSPLQAGEYVYVYFDKYAVGKYGAVRSKDMKTWEDVSDLVAFPKGCRHGTAFVTAENVLNRILKYNTKDAK